MVQLDLCEFFQDKCLNNDCIFYYKRAECEAHACMEEFGRDYCIGGYHVYQVELGGIGILLTILLSDFNIMIVLPQ